MIKQTILLLVLFSTHVSYSQQEHEEAIATAKLFIDEGKNDPVKYEIAKTILEPYAEYGDSNALNLLGLMYLREQFPQKNEDKAFELIENAARKGLHQAEYNLGRFYKLGTGCDIDFDTAINWFEKAADHGNERAAYSIGYMYLKGLGVKQDYKEAINWFELSTYPMAKHWLGYCYYFGYGVAQDTEKAYEILAANNIINSQFLLNHINDDIESAKNMKLSNDQKEFISDTDIALIELKDKSNEENRKTYTANSKTVIGTWTGKIIEFDWSGKSITKAVPITITFNNIEDSENLEYEIKIEDSANKGIGICIDNSVYFENFHFILEESYNVNPRSSTVDWQLLSSKMNIEQYEEEYHLIGNLETYSKEWEEPGPPRMIILKSLNQEKTEEAIVKYSNENLETLSENTNSPDNLNHFIQSYPNPFINDFLVEYELENEDFVTIEIFGYQNQSIRKMIEPGVTQNKGKHKYNLDGSNYPPGLYIISVMVGHEKHTRILIKN